MSLIRMESWDRLARTGPPVMVVVNKPLPYRGEILPIGAEFNDPTNPTRLRQFYEQRRIAPKVPVPASINRHMRPSSMVASRPSDPPASNPAIPLGSTVSPTTSTANPSKPVQATAKPDPAVGAQPAKRWGRAVRKAQPPLE